MISRRNKGTRRKTAGHDTGDVLRFDRGTTQDQAGGEGTTPGPAGGRTRGEKSVFDEKRPRARVDHVDGHRLTYFIARTRLTQERALGITRTSQLWSATHRHPPVRPTQPEMYPVLEVPESHQPRSDDYMGCRGWSRDD